MTTRASVPGGSVSDPNIEKLRRQLETYMLDHGLRSTEQRRVIIEMIFDSCAHMSIDDLLQRARAIDPRIGYATVYRTMKLMTEAHVVHEHRFGDGFTRYEVADEDAHHDHLICLACGSITEFEEPLIEELQERVAERHGFEVRSHKHELYGRCDECRREGKGIEEPPRTKRH